MDNESEMIKHQMEETRSDLVEKLETLENQVVETVQGTTGAVSDTVENVKEAVEETVEKVKDTVQRTVEAVKDTFNVPLQVQRHPWIMMGGAVAAGFIVGRFFGRATPAGTSAGQPARPVRSHLAEAAPQAAPSRGDWFSGLTDTFGSEIGKLKSLAIGTLGGMLRETIAQAVPGQVGEKITGVIDHLTTKLGGEVLSSSALHDLSGSLGSRGQAPWEQTEAAAPGFRYG